MKQIAVSAFVGERTLDDAFPSKAVLYEHVDGVAITGDEQPIAIAERRELLDALAQRDVSASIGAFADYPTEILEQSGPLSQRANPSSATAVTSTNSETRNLSSQKRWSRARKRGRGPSTNASERHENRIVETIPTHRKRAHLPIPKRDG